MAERETTGLANNTHPAPDFRVIGVPGIGMIENGDDLVAVITEALTQNQLTLERGDGLGVEGGVYRA